MSKLYRQVTRRKPVSRIQAEAASGEGGDGHGAPSKDGELKRVLGLADLTAFGVSSTIGAGVFVVTGLAARDNAGPALVLSFLFSAIACLFSGLCYCEFATRVPIAGSAYTYAYATLGELMGWFIGWNLTLEYGISASAVARGWSDYVKTMFEGFGAPLPSWMYSIPLPFGIGGSCSLLGAFIVGACTTLACFGVKDSATFNIVMTIVNCSVIAFVIIAGSVFVTPSNWSNFTPYGISGIFQGSATVFFSYIGFDTVSALAQEVKNPGRNLPLGIVSTLGVAATLYCGVSLVITGMVPFYMLKDEAPLSKAFAELGKQWAANLVNVGSVTTLTANVLCSIIGQPRIYMRMAKDGLLFSCFSKVSEKYQTPIWGTIFTGVVSGLLAFLLDIGTLTNMISIGTLLAFDIVCVGVIIMRFQDSPNSSKGSWLTIAMFFGAFFVSGLAKIPGMSTAGIWSLCVCVGLVVVGIPTLLIWRTMPSLAEVKLSVLKVTPDANPFFCPWVPLIPMLGVMINTYMLFQLGVEAMIRLAVWTVLGLIIYFLYGYRNSALGKEAKAQDKLLEQAQTPLLGSDIESAAGASPYIVPMTPDEIRPAPIVARSSRAGLNGSSLIHEDASPAVRPLSR